MWIRGYIHACKADTNRRFLSHTAQESIMYIFHIKFSPPVFTTLMFAVVFSVHNSSGGVKLMLPHQEERTNNKPNSFSSSSHPVYERILSSFTLFPRSLVSFFSLLCIVLCPQVRGSLCFLLLKPGKQRRRMREAS